MSTQLSFFNSNPEDDNTGLITPRHLNRDISCSPGLQEATTVPGLKFVEGFLTPEEQSYCVQRIDNAISRRGIPNPGRTVLLRPAN